MPESFEYEFRTALSLRQRGADSSASLLFHAGRCHFVTCGSRHEAELLERGALLIGTLRFDAPPGGAGRRVESVSAETFSAAPAWGSTRN